MRQAGLVRSMAIPRFSMPRPSLAQHRHCLMVRLRDIRDVRTAAGSSCRPTSPWPAHAGHPAEPARSAAAGCCVPSQPSDGSARLGARPEVPQPTVLPAPSARLPRGHVDRIGGCPAVPYSLRSRRCDRLASSLAVGSSSARRASANGRCCQAMWSASPMVRRELVGLADRSWPYAFAGALDDSPDTADAFGVGHCPLAAAGDVDRRGVSENPPIPLPTSATLNILICGVTEGCEVKAGAGEEAVEQAGPEPAPEPDAGPSARRCNPGHRPPHRPNLQAWRKLGDAVSSAPRRVRGCCRPRERSRCCWSVRRSRSSGRSRSGRPGRCRGQRCRRS